MTTRWTNDDAAPAPGPGPDADDRPPVASPRFPAPIRATSDDLPAAAAAAIRDARALPETGDRSTTIVSGAGPEPIRFSALAWGPADGRPLLLIHGVTSSARTYWRVGPALAAIGWRAIAVDLPGHGATVGGGDGRDAGFAETASLVAGFARIAFDDAPFAIVGHSWGAMVAAHLPPTGLRPGRIVLLDPPVMDQRARRGMVDDPDSRPEPSFDRALATIRALKPGWSEGDRIVKAEALTQLDGEMAAAVLLGNGDWDGGLAVLADPSVRGIPVWIVRGEDETGSLTPASWLPGYADLIGADHILTIAGGEHSPQRLAIEATVVALLRALEG